MRGRLLLRQGLGAFQRSNRKAARREEEARRGHAISHFVLRRLRRALGGLRRHVRLCLPYPIVRPPRLADLVHVYITSPHTYKWQAALRQARAVGLDKAALWYDLREKEQALRRWAGVCEGGHAARRAAEVSPRGWSLEMIDGSIGFC